MENEVSTVIVQRLNDLFTGRLLLDMLVGATGGRHAKAKAVPATTPAARTPPDATPRCND